MAKTYGQIQDGVKDLKDFEAKVAEKLKNYVLLKWQNQKTVNLVRKLYKQGYNVDDAVGMIILNS